MRTQDAIIRNLQVMGEAAKKVSAETRDAHPEIPWKDIAGMRDRVVHDYFGISLDIVWDVVVNHIHPLREKVTGWGGSLKTEQAEFRIQGWLSFAVRS